MRANVSFIFFTFSLIVVIIILSIVLAPWFEKNKSLFNNNQLPVKEQTESKFHKSFEVISVLGEGGFGKVLEAREKRTATLFAVKTIEKRDTAKSASTEAQILKKLKHPNIVQYFDHWEEPDCLYIQMQHCGHGNLEDWLQKNSLQARAGKTIFIFNQLVGALCYMHGIGVTHGDLKPANIFFDSETNIRVGDFGLASMRQISFDCAGTRFYKAPEICYSQYTNKVDIYAAGVILFMLFNSFWCMLTQLNALSKLENSEYPSGFVKNFPRVVRFE